MNMSARGKWDRRRNPRQASPQWAVLSAADSPLRFFLGFVLDMRDGTG